MIIQIDEKTRIRGTSMCWQLERCKNKGGVWKPYKYFKTFGLALSAAGEAEIRTHPANTLSEAIEAASAITQKYGELFALAEFEAREKHRNEPARTEAYAEKAFE